MYRCSVYVMRCLALVAGNTSSGVGGGDTLDGRRYRQFLEAGDSVVTTGIHVIKADEHIRISGVGCTSVGGAEDRTRGRGGGEGLKIFILCNNCKNCCWYNSNKKASSKKAYALFS